MSQAASRGKRLLHLALKKKDEDPPRKKKRKIAPLAPPSQRHKPNLLELYDTGQWDKLCPILNKQLLTTSKDLTAHTFVATTKRTVPTLAPD